MQRTAAEIIRRSVDEEFLSHFDLPHSAHTGSSTTHVQGSIYIKTLMVKYYDLRPGASSTQYQKVEEIISNYGNGENDQCFESLTVESTQMIYNRHGVRMS